MNSPQIVIKPLRPEEAGDALSVLHESWKVMVGKSYPREIIRAMDRFYTRERLERLLANPDRRTLGAWSHGRLLGCLWGYQSPIDGTFSLDWVVVRKDVVGEGVFSRLLKKVERQLRKENVLKIILFASNKNIPAIRRYLKLGYAIEGVHPNHFFGWTFLSLGKVLVRKHWKGRITRLPDFIRNDYEIRQSD